MARETFSMNLYIKISPSMHEHLRLVSEREGMAISELVRWGIRDKLRAFDYLPEPEPFRFPKADQMTDASSLTREPVRILLARRGQSGSPEGDQTGDGIMEITAVDRERLGKDLEGLVKKDLVEMGNGLGMGISIRNKKADIVEAIIKRRWLDDKAVEAEIQKGKEKPTRTPTKKEVREQMIADADPWEGPEWECKTPAAFVQAGLLLGIDPYSTWKAITIRWPDYRGAGGFGTIGTYRGRMKASGALTKDGKPGEKGKEMLEKWGTGPKLVE